MIFQSVRIKKQKNSSTDKHLISVFYIYILKDFLCLYKTGIL